MITEADAQDFMETADKIYHQKMSMVQMDLQKKREKYFADVKKWGLAQYEKHPECKNQIEHEINRYMEEFNRNATWERQQHQRRLDLERARLKISIMQTVTDD